MPWYVDPNALSSIGIQLLLFYFWPIFFISKMGSETIGRLYYMVPDDFESVFDKACDTQVYLRYVVAMFLIPAGAAMVSMVFHLTQ